MRTANGSPFIQKFIRKLVQQLQQYNKDFPSHIYKKVAEFIRGLLYFVPDSKAFKSIQNEIRAALPAHQFYYVQSRSSDSSSAAEETDRSRRSFDGREETKLESISGTSFLRFALSENESLLCSVFAERRFCDRSYREVACGVCWRESVASNLRGCCLQLSPTFCSTKAPSPSDC